MSGGQGKLPGKSKYSGRRRAVTRKSGFKSANSSTGGEFTQTQIMSTEVSPSAPLRIAFEVPQVKGQLSGFGGWFCSDTPVGIRIEGNHSHPTTLVQYPAPDWGKFGSLWIAEQDGIYSTTVEFTSKTLSQVAVYKPECGVVRHPHLDNAFNTKPELLQNMYQFSPEANFITEAGISTLTSKRNGVNFDLYTKSCNRCARFLPINVHDERAHLSFSNHCVAEHRRPCSHAGFGRLSDANSGVALKLEYGYQLECRFCKKFEVNAAHNPMRSAGQMKEDGTRRRSIELLLTELLGGSEQMLFRHRNQGLELAEYIWIKFGKRCFNCSQPIADAKSMHLDHTRPLALLWPLDETGTCLCEDCNSQKRDRSPSEYYSAQKLVSLARITGIPLMKLKNPGPNLEALDLLFDRSDWFFDTFLQRPELRREHDGKVTGELLVKALQKVVDRSGLEYPSLKERFERR